MAEDTFCLFLELKGRAPLLTEALLLGPWAWQLGQCERCRGLDIVQTSTRPRSLLWTQGPWGLRGAHGQEGERRLSGLRREEPETVCLWVEGGGAFLWSLRVGE